jgi:hypothetical protein
MGVQPEVARCGQRVKNCAGREEAEEQRPWVVDRLVERWQSRERDCGPQCENQTERRIEQAAPADE